MHASLLSHGEYYRCLVDSEDDTVKTQVMADSMKWEAINAIA